MLADEFRPNTIEEVIGNDSIKASLTSYFESGSLPHTIVLEGQYGAGKTSLARIIARMLDGEIQEFNCGANGDIDTIRKIVNESQLGSIFSNKKVIVLDEVHKLSNAAQQVLLKDTEEPAPDTYFILCTSKGETIVPALRSRGVRFEVQPVDADGFREAVKRITSVYHISVEDRKDWWKVVNASENSLRVFYNIADKLIASGLKTTTGIYLDTGAFDAAVNKTTEEEQTETSPLPVAFMQKSLLAALSSIDASKKEAGRTPFGTLVGLYIFLKRKDPVRYRVLLGDIAEVLAKKELTSDWYCVEMIAFRNLT